MSNIPTRETFSTLYAEKAPWDIGRAQKVFIEAAGKVQGAVLDAGCGTGENALYFAGRGHSVVGIDFLDFPIQEAQRKARERGLAAEFIRRDALTLDDFGRKFDSIIDSGLFHVFSDEDRIRYVASLAHVIHPGGLVFLACFSDEQPEGFGPRRVSQRELRQAFAAGWEFDSIQPTRFEVIPEMQDAFGPGGPKGWFAVIRRKS